MTTSAAPSVSIIIKELLSKKKFFAILLILSIITVNLANLYKGTRPQVLRLSIFESYFPLIDDIKKDIRISFVNTFRDQEALLNYVQNERLKEKLKNNDLIINLKIQGEQFGTYTIDRYVITVTLSGVTEKKEYDYYANAIPALIENVEKSLRSTMSQNLEKNVRNYHFLSLYQMGSKKKKSQAFADRETSIILLGDDSARFLQVHPVNPKFEKKLMARKKKLSLIIAIMFGGITLVILRRFLK